MWFYHVWDRRWLAAWGSLVVSGLLLPGTSRPQTKDLGCLGRVAGQPRRCRAEPRGTAWGCP